MKWAGHVMCMRQMRNYVQVCSEYLKKREHLGDEAYMGEKY